MKQFVLTTIAGCAAVLIASGSAAQLATADTNAMVLSAEYLGELSEQMRTNHPALRAAEARTRAAGFNADAVRRWEDPMISVGGMGADEMMRREDGDVIYGVEQKLPLFGKPKLARKLARAESATEAANLDYQFQKLRSEFAQAAFRTALAHEVVRIGEEDLAWLALMAQTVEAKVRSGEATLVEALQLQNEQSKRATALETDRTQLSHDVVTLNRFLGRDQQTPWPRLELPEPAGPIFFNQRLLDFAFRYEPKSEMIRREILQTAASVEVAQRNRWPDINLGFEGRNYSENGDFRQGMLQLSMNLPWANTRRYRSEIKREEARLKAVEFELADYQAGLREEVHLLTVRIDAARREALLYRDQILPRTRAALEATQAGWESNRATVRDLLDARRMLLEARLMQARAVSEQYQMLSDLVLCCGLGDLGALQMLGAEPSATPSAPATDFSK
jgi:cobalt-zinc-cadmium efflux system outer membrane protein